MNISWGSTFFMYTLAVFLFNFTGIVGALFLPIMLGLSTVHPPNSNARKGVMFTAWIFFYVFWRGLTFYYLFQNLKIFVESDTLQPNKHFFVTDRTIKPILAFHFIGGLINALWFCSFEELFKRIISLKLLIIAKTKGVKRETIEIPFDMKIMQAGTNYFKKLISTRKIPDANEISQSFLNNDEEIQECMICCTNKSNVLIRPCNHGGICERCVITYLGTNTSCPNCKTPITKIYVMNYDEDLKKYYGTKVLTLL
jgi:hypothetical protein